MAFPREPDEPYRSIQDDDDIRRRMSSNEMPPRPSRFDDELQPDLGIDGRSGGRRADCCLCHRSHVDPGWGLVWRRAYDQRYCSDISDAADQYGCKRPIRGSPTGDET